jgi:hypothetical protein
MQRYLSALAAFHCTLKWALGSLFSINKDLKKTSANEMSNIFFVIYVIRAKKVSLMIDVLRSIDQSIFIKIKS